MMIEIFKAPLVRVIAFSNQTGSFEKDQAITWMLCLKKGLAPSGKQLVIQYMNT